MGGAVPCAGTQCSTVLSVPPRTPARDVFLAELSLEGARRQSVVRQWFNHLALGIWWGSALRATPLSLSWIHQTAYASVKQEEESWWENIALL
jgi:hypothetical protein